MIEPDDAAPPPISRDADPHLTALMHELMPFTALLGLRAVVGDASRVIVHCTWSPMLCTAGGAVHGGLLMALADAAGAACATFNLPGHALTTTIESKTNFFRPVLAGRITATAEPMHVGRSTIVLQTRISRDDGKLVSATIQTQTVTVLEHERV